MKKEREDHADKWHVKR